MGLKSLVHKIEIDDHPGRVRALVDGATVFDTTRAKVLHEGRHPDRIYVPIEDFDESLLAPSEHTSHCPFKGDASYWSIRVGDTVRENAVWAYTEPYDDVSEIAGYASFYREKVDEVVDRPA